MLVNVLATEEKPSVLNKRNKIAFKNKLSKINNMVTENNFNLNRITEK